MVPYLLMWDNNGQFISVDDMKNLFSLEISENIDISDNNRFNHSKYDSTILQCEHPYLGKPYFSLNICGLNELLDAFKFDTPENYFLAWLQSVMKIFDIYMTIDEFNRML